MELKFNVIGNKRKELVKVISEVTGEKAEYKYMPTCAYEIGTFTVDKEVDNEKIRLPLLSPVAGLYWRRV